MHRRPGIFVTFEGPEGSGKSTLIRSLEGALQPLLPKKRKIVTTREPGGTKVAEKVRALILENPMNPWTELMLYEAARSEHVATTIEPALNAGHIVLCDRYTDSSLAYQAFARGLPWKSVEKLNAFATREFTPDLTVLLDIDPELGLSRAKDPNRFEREGLEFHRRVRKDFLKARGVLPKRWITLKVDRRATPEWLAARVIAELQKRFAKKLRAK